MRPNRATAVAIVAISLVLSVGALLGCLGRDFGEDKAAVYQAVIEAAASVANDEEFAAALIDMGFEVDVEHASTADLTAGNKASIALKCWCNLSYPFAGSKQWVKVWKGLAHYDGVGYASILWGNPNYDLDLVAVNHTTGVTSISAYKYTNFESFNENACLGNSGCPNFHTGNNIQGSKNDLVSLWVAMWDITGYPTNLSGPMEFSCCMYIEPI